MHIYRTAWLALALAFSGSAGADGLDDSWLALIKADFEPSCSVERTGVGLVITDNNGYRQEQWFVTTCHGKLEYVVAYYPPDAFPHKSNPFEVAKRKPG